MFGRIDGIERHADTRGSGQRFVQEAESQTFNGPEQLRQFVFTAALEESDLNLQNFLVLCAAEGFELFGERNHDDLHFLDIPEFVLRKEEDFRMKVGKGLRHRFCEGDHC